MLQETLVAPNNQEDEIYALDENPKLKLDEPCIMLFVGGQSPP